MREFQRYTPAIKIDKPTVLLDSQKVKANIEKMAVKAQTSGVKFRPHFKTHQSAEIGDWFRNYGVDSITVSSLSMAKYFAEHDWRDITVAINVNLLEIDSINELAPNINLNLILDHENAVDFLGQYLKYPVNIFIKIDTGYGRTGIHWQDQHTISYILQKISRSSKMSFVGLLTHTGHNYEAKSIEQIKRNYQQTVSRLIELKHKILQNGLPQCWLSIGDTPSCQVAENFKPIDEIRPGNFVFYDLMQYHLGVCSIQEIAVAVACPVIGKYPDRNEVVIYGGAVHFSKDYLLNENGVKVFGYLAVFENNKWDALNKDIYLYSLSQEHGKLKVTDEFMKQVQLGDVLCFFPVHSCLTTNLHRHYQTLDGKIISRFNLE